MSYTDPSTRATGYIVQAADWNVLVNNFKETMVAKVTTAGDTAYATGANALARLAIGGAGTFSRSTGSAPEWANPEDGAKLDGDHLDIDYTPTNYTPTTSPAEAADVDDLAAHLAGIDAKLGIATVRIKTGSYTGDGATSLAITGVGFAPKYVKIWLRVTADDTLDSKVIETTDTIVDDHAEGGAHTEGETTSSEPAFRANRIIALGADGFTVDDDAADGHPNTTSAVYNYLALG